MALKPCSEVGDAGNGMREAVILSLLGSQLQLQLSRNISLAPPLLTVYYLFCLTVYYPYCPFWLVDLGNVPGGKDSISACDPDPIF